MSELQPWSGPEDGEVPDEPKLGYLLGAGLLAGLVLAIGSRALLGHFAQRPELAAADPLMAEALRWGQWVGWALAAVCAVLLGLGWGPDRKSL